MAINFCTSGLGQRTWRMAAAVAFTGTLLEAHAQENTAFDSSFLRRFADSSLTLDLGGLDNAHSLPPGTYPVALQLNGKPMGRQTIVFVAEPTQQQLRPCMTSALLDSLGIGLSTPDEHTCLDITQTIADSQIRFDSQALVLDISVPQAHLRRTPNGLIEEQEWDSGINAAMLNYQINAAHGQRAGQGQGYQGSVYLQAGVNFAGWRLRSSSALSRDGRSAARWQRNNTYAQRDLPRHWGNLTLGEHFTPGNVFDSLPYRGIQLASDMGMLPESMRGYAPVVRGLAQTQAKVEIRQNGYSLYTTYVPPGPFVIDNLSSAGGSGELEVIVTEADGSVRRFIQPYATLSNMLRPGIWQHSLTVGQYMDGNADAMPTFTEATLAYGLPLDLTLYGGLQASSFYQAAQGGAGTSLGNLGAISLDVTQAYTDHTGRRRDQGKSYGWRYGKSFTTGTSLRFAGYRYSTQGYRDFNEAVWQQSPNRITAGNKRNRIEVSLAQSTAQGSLYLGIFEQTYWGNRRREQQLQAGLNTYWQGISYGLYANRNLGSGDRYQQLSLTLSIPLGQSTSASYSATVNQGSIGHRASLAGQLDPANNWRYGLDASRSEQGAQAGSASLNYRSPAVLIGTSLSAGSGYHQATLSAAGSMLGHADGVEFGQSLGETVALIDTNGVANIGVQNTPGSRTGRRGYATVPYLTPYRRNRIALDTDHLGLEVDIENSVLQTVPRRGAVIKTRFEVQRTHKLIALLRLPNGDQPPFGSQVVDNENRPVGVVGPGGQVLLAIGDDVRQLTAKWNDHAGGRCTIALPLVSAHEPVGYSARTLVCQPTADLASAGPAPTLYSQKVAL
jgi:outer membrane usher protein